MAAMRMTLTTTAATEGGGGGGELRDQTKFNDEIALTTMNQFSSKDFRKIEERMEETSAERPLQEENVNGEVSERKCQTTARHK
ncbi:hypothetical protein RUM44_003895 [Polyplax serrata]|uniref:Uncharacterized protein n=1 Tax=Polyplax serrata TaxID=468196 RepID=A0ABR1B198_POLSC